VRGAGSEIYPTRVRSRGSGPSAGVGTFGGVTPGGQGIRATAP
jgi:hypothetical protein